MPRQSPDVLPLSQVAALNHLVIVGGRTMRPRYAPGRNHKWDEPVPRLDSTEPARFAGWA